MEKLISFGFPSKELLSFDYGQSPIPPPPFKAQWLNDIFVKSMNVSFPMTVALVYFSFVHFVNPKIVARQEREFKKKNPSKSLPKRVPAAPFGFTQTKLFKAFVLLHNVFLCVYSVWTFVGMVRSMDKTSKLIKSSFESLNSGLGISYDLHSNFHTVVQTICDINNGLFNLDLPYHSLLVIGWWFYMSKFYEILDTVIILVKGRPSSLLQSYHHSGAIMCMWAGIRFQSPPIWIFVVFNSFIHSLMYFYFSLSCLKIHVPNTFKRVLTSMQITQFVVGGSLAVLHSFVYFTDVSTNKLINCINTPDKALPLIINVSYLTPLTGLFAAFYIESYIKRK